MLPSVDYLHGEESNFEDLSEDAAMTEFSATFGELAQSAEVTPDEIAVAVDGLLDTLNNCVTKVATLEEMLAYVFDYVAGGQTSHYSSAVFLSQLAEKYTREVEGKIFARVLILKMREVRDTCITMIELLSSGDADRNSVHSARNLALFFADLTPRLAPIPYFKMAVPAFIDAIGEIIAVFMDDHKGVTQDDLLENSECAISMIKLAGPAIDEIVRKDRSIAQKVAHIVPKIYSSIRNLLISHNYLTPRVRAGIIKVLEFRASRWGEFPSPDQPLSDNDPVGVDEVDPLLDGGVLNEEETSFLNEAVEELNLNEDPDNNGYEYSQENGNYEQQYGDFDRRPIWERDSVPSDALEEFRRIHKPKFEPDAAGDRRDNQPHSSLG